MCKCQCERVNAQTLIYSTWVAIKGSEKLETKTTQLPFANFPQATISTVYRKWSSEGQLSVSWCGGHYFGTLTIGCPSSAISRGTTFHVTILKSYRAGFLNMTMNSPDFDPAECYNHIHNTHYLHGAPIAHYLESWKLGHQTESPLQIRMAATFKAHSYLISSLRVTLMPTYLKALTRCSEVLLKRLHLFCKCQSKADASREGGRQYLYGFSINKGRNGSPEAQKHHEMTMPHNEYVQ